MSPEFAFTTPALLFFWEDLCKDVNRGVLPLLWKILLEVRSRLEMKLMHLSDEQRTRLEGADEVIRVKLVGLLKQEGCYAEYLDLGASHDQHYWWFHLEGQE